MKPGDIVRAYGTEGSIKKVAALFRVSEQKVRKVLIDAGAYESDMSIQVNDLYEQGYSVEHSRKIACKQEHCFSISAIHQRRVSWRKSFQQCS